jgi:hypothetical protein
VSKRNTVSVTVLSALAVATLAMFVTVATAFAPGAPIGGIDIKLGKNPGGNAAARTGKTDKDGKVTFLGLAAGNYSLTVQELTAETLRQNHLSATDNYEVEVSGAGLAGGTMNRSWDPTKKKAYEPPSATARTSAPHYTDSIDFEIKGATSALTVIVKSRSNIKTN